MAQKIVFLHIGTHKTGSTSIQNVLTKEKEKLKKEGIYYLGSFRELSKPMKLRTEYDEEHVRRFQKNARERIEQNKKFKPHTYIASNENWSGRMLNAYDNAALNAKILYDIFKPFEFEIKIIVYLRRQDLFLESAYAQKIKRGDIDVPFIDFLEVVNSKKLHWNNLLDSYAEFFGRDNIIVERFAKEYLPTPNSLIQSFGKIINSNHLTRYEKTVVENRGYSKDVMEFARLANKHLTSEEIRTLRSLLIEANIKSDNYSYFNVNNRKELLSHFEKSNRKVVTDYLGGKEDELFSIKELADGKSPKDYKGFSIEALAMILSKLILIQNQKVLSKIEHNRKLKLHNFLKQKFRDFFHKKLKNS